LKVGGWLDLNGLTQLTYLPSDIQVGKEIYYPEKGKELPKKDVSGDDTEQDSEDIEGESLDDFPNYEAIPYTNEEPKKGDLVIVAKEYEKSFQDKKGGVPSTLKTSIEKRIVGKVKTWSSSMADVEIQNIMWLMKPDEINKVVPKGSDASSVKEEDIDITNLSSDLTLEEYFTILENYTTKYEYTGGKKRKVTTTTDGYRVDKNKSGTTKRHKMSFGEKMRRKRGAVRGNIKAKGKLPLANAKKIQGQKMNPNSPTGKF
jgi:hypothetical protein